jgi:hypothetical protein
MKLVCALLLVYGFILSSCSNHAKTAEAPAIPQDSLVRRGAYLVTLAGCGDCHSPKVMTAMGPVPDTTRLFSGHRSSLPVPEVSKDAFAKGWALFNGENTSMATPGFVSFSANISSDTTGIGAWTFAQFKTAMTKGKYKGLAGGRDLLPPMPWPNYAQMREEDLQAIFSFLKSTKPVHNIVPPPVMAGSF